LGDRVLKVHFFAQYELWSIESLAPLNMCVKSQDLENKGSRRRQAPRLKDL